MEKEIIGYKLIKPEYEQVAVKIVQIKSKSINNTAKTFKELDHVEDLDFQSRSYSAEILKESGVLDLWFEPVYKPTELVKSWWESFNGKGWFIDTSSQIEFRENLKKHNYNNNIFKTEAQAKSALAFAQLSHIVADANGDWVADWFDQRQNKYVVELSRNNLISTYYCSTKQLLPMKSEEIADACLEKHRTLWENFWMISK